MIQFMVSYPGLDPATTDIDKLKRALIYAASTLRYPIEHALGPYHNYHGVVVHQRLRGTWPDSTDCSFCGDDETKYKKVMAGPDHLYICDACINLAASWCCCPESVHSDDAIEDGLIDVPATTPQEDLDFLSATLDALYADEVESVEDGLAPKKGTE